MRYVLEYTRENRDIVSSEINAIKETFRDFDIIYKSDFIYIIEGNYRDIENSGFINYISQIIDEKPDYNEFNCKIPEGKFYVRASVPPGYNTEMVESTVGKILGGRGRISFNNPDFIVRAVKADIWYLGILVYSRNKKDFESRRAPLRPFFSPVSLHPKYARYLINTSYTRPGDTVLDPFCGTGGILIEAALMGRRIIGNDALLNMVMGTKLNLKYFDLKYIEIYNLDIKDLNINKAVDAIVTDMPYGRSSSVNDYDIQNLYKTSFEKFNELLKSHGKCSIIVNNLELLEYSKKFFKIINSVPVYQHRSLIRYFVIIEKIS